jgi:hypothetical protein
MVKRRNAYVAEIHVLLPAIRVGATWHSLFRIALNSRWKPLQKPDNLPGWFHEFIGYSNHGMTVTSNRRKISGDRSMSEVYDDYEQDLFAWLEAHAKGAVDVKGTLQGPKGELVLGLLLELQNMGHECIVWSNSNGLSRWTELLISDLNHERAESDLGQV